MSIWQEHINESIDLLLSLSVTDINGHEIETDMAFKQLQNYALGVMERRKTIYFIGNGRNASIANDAASVIAEHTGIHTETFFNFNLITSIANNSNYEDIFVEPLKKRIVAGDMLVAISSSGESRNINNAVRETLRIGGNACTLSANDPENSLRSMGTLNFYIPAENPMNAAPCSMEIMNYWIDQLITVVSWQESLKQTYVNDSVIDIRANKLISN